MLRNLALALVTMMALAHLPATADEALQTPQPLTELTQLQQTIDSDIAKLGNANGEMKQFIEYRIKEHANQLHDKFKLMMNQQPLDKANLLPLLQKHLAFIDRKSVV